MQSDRDVMRYTVLALSLSFSLAGCVIEEDSGVGDPISADETAPLARKATITCDFGSDAVEPEFVFGKMSFAVDLDAKKVPVECVGGDCILDGDEQEMTLLTKTRWENNKALGFGGADAESNVRQLIIDGSTGDDLELTIYISYFPEQIDGEDAQALLIINDGQFINGTSLVSSCTSVVK